MRDMVKKILFYLPLLGLPLVPILIILIFLVFLVTQFITIYLYKESLIDFRRLV